MTEQERQSALDALECFFKAFGEYYECQDDDLIAKAQRAFHASRNALSSPPVQTDEQSKAALDGLRKLASHDVWHYAPNLEKQIFWWFKEYASSLEAALSSPAVPVIEGFSEGDVKHCEDIERSMREENDTPLGYRMCIPPQETDSDFRFKRVFQAARAYAALAKMQKVDLDCARCAVYGDNSTQDIANKSYNAALDDIKAKYGELYAEVK